MSKYHTQFLSMILSTKEVIVLMKYRDIMKSLREDRDLTQQQVAKIINKSQQGYNHIETGRAELKIEDLIKLCDFYEVSADYFIGRKEK